jgi:hypothetical protein
LVLAAALALTAAIAGCTRLRLTGLEASGAGTYVAHVHLEGNVPGGTVDLQYRFTVDGDAIRRLEIGP